MPLALLTASFLIAVTTPDTLWSFCPSIAAAYVLIVAFALTVVAHIAQGIYHRKWYTWVISMVRFIISRVLRRIE